MSMPVVLSIIVRCTQSTQVSSASIQLIEEEEEVERTTNQIINNNLMTRDANYKHNIDVYTMFDSKTHE